MVVSVPFLQRYSAVSPRSIGCTMSHIAMRFAAFLRPVAAEPAVWRWRITYILGRSAIYSVFLQKTVASRHWDLFVWSLFSLFAKLFSGRWEIADRKWLIN